jgi:hypothetical protein
MSQKSKKSVLQIQVFFDQGSQKQKGKDHSSLGTKAFALSENENCK